MFNPKKAISAPTPEKPNESITRARETYNQTREGMADITNQISQLRKAMGETATFRQDKRA